MDNNQRTSLTVNLLVGGTIVTIMLLANMLIKRYMPHVLQYLSLIILGIVIIGLSIYLYRLKMNIPGRSLYEFTSTLWILTILVIAPLLIGFFYKDSEYPDWILPIMLVTAAMWSAHGVFKQQQKRIDELEEKLNQQNQSEK